MLFWVWMTGKTSPNRAAAITSYQRVLFGELLPTASKGRLDFSLQKVDPMR